MQREVDKILFNKSSPSKGRKLLNKAKDKKNKENQKLTNNKTPFSDIIQSLLLQTYQRYRCR